MSLPEYTDKKMKGNIGEAFAQYVLSQFCLVHKIDGSFDIGNDFICELVKDQSPTNLLFYVQVKYTKRSPQIKDATKNYWKGSPIPVFLFWIYEGAENRAEFLSNLMFEKEFRSIKYKRITPFTHKVRHKNEKFQKFNKIKFLRDLVMDYARCQYQKGFTPVITARDFLTLDDKIMAGLPRHGLFIKVIKEYSNEILRDSWSNMFITAILLYKKGGKDNLLKAKATIDLIKLIYKRDYEHATFFNFSDDVKKYERLINQELNK